MNVVWLVILIVVALAVALAAGCIWLAAFVIKRFLAQNRELVQMTLAEQAQKVIHLQSAVERNKAKAKALLEHEDLKKKASGHTGPSLGSEF